MIIEQTKESNQKQNVKFSLIMIYNIQVLEPLLGNYWPCIDPMMRKRFRSKSNLMFGEEMFWLLEGYWKERWIDQKLTFCNMENITTKSDESARKSLVFSFLQFTQVTTNSMMYSHSQS